MDYIEKNEMKFDNLIGGTAVTPLLANVSITAVAGTTKRGTLMTESGGKYAATVKSGVASAVLAEDIVSEAGGSVTGTVFVRGEFNREAVKAASGDTVEAHEIELRKIGIYLTSVK